MDQTLGITQPASKPSLWRRLAANRHAWTFAGVVLALVVIGAAFQQSAFREELGRERIARFLAPQRSGRTASAALELRTAEADLSSNVENSASPAAEASEPEAAPPQASGDGSVSASVTSPMIAQTASLTIVPANYEQAAGSIGALVTARGGYVQKLDSDASSDSARSVSVTLRVPAKETDALLGDLRKLGRVEAESRENEEVTDQYVDLDARLQNARAAEQRLIQLLAGRTGKLEDVLDAERELTRVRGNVESMTGERNLLVHRVTYATVEVQLQEQYRAQLGSGAPAGTLRNALIQGFRNLAAGAIAALAFVLAYGPSMLFWLAILGLPAWLVWRAARRKFATVR